MPYLALSIFHGVEDFSFIVGELVEKAIIVI